MAVPHENPKLLSSHIFRPLPKQAHNRRFKVNETQDYLIVTKGPRMGEKIPLSKLPIVAGREETTDFYVKSAECLT